MYFSKKDLIKFEIDVDIEYYNITMY